MKNIFYILIIILMLSPTLGQAQINESEQNKIASLKIAYINDALNLSAKEAQQFWAVYDKYEKEEALVRNNLLCNIYQKLDNIHLVPVEEAETLLRDYVELRNEKHKLWQNYVDDLRKVISAKKIMLLKKAEYNFHKQLLEKYRTGNQKK